jgi:hypothetical protein
MTPDEIFNAMLEADLSISQIKAVCDIAIQAGSNFNGSAYYILDEIIPELKNIVTVHKQEYIKLDGRELVNHLNKVRPGNILNRFVP